MESISVVTLEGKIYSCKQCGTHLALSEDIISKSFHCRNGKAYFVNNVVNVITGQKEGRMMIAGMFINVADISLWLARDGNMKMPMKRVKNSEKENG